MTWTTTIPTEGAPRRIVVSFTTLDGVVEDPDGSNGTPFGGWAMRHGPEAIAGDKFRLGPILQHGTLLFGRRTGGLFKTIWPHRDDVFSQGMNAAAKAVLTHGPIDETEWSHSTAIDTDLAHWVQREIATDIVVIGSLSIVAELARQDLVQQYRLLIFPTVLNAGRTLFTGHRELTLISTKQVGPSILATLTPNGEEPS